MQEWLIDILRNPQTGNRLRPVPTAGNLEDEQTGVAFPVKENIPVFTEIQRNEQTDLHKKLGTEFDYIDHYQTDAEFFDYFEEDDNPATVHDLKRFRQSVLKRIPKQSRRILDVGCGKAWVAEAMIAEGKQVVSLDIAFANTSKALQRIPSPSHAAVIADVYNLPFPEHTFDCVTACEIMEHTYDPALFVEKLWRIVKPGGTLIISVPYKEKIKYNLCIHCNRPTPENAHLHSFDKKKLEKLSRQPDAERIEIKPVGNKVLVQLRTHLLFRHTGFKCWNAMDSLASHVLDKAYRVILVMKKK
jgi:2-polyprenyl-3-methyl-5-hydroxy-6-metoxy-1,4-benzoquinol methylase